jgi:hypothetical protein
LGRAETKKKVPKTPSFYNAWVSRHLGENIWTLGLGLLPDTSNLCVGLVFSSRIPVLKIFNWKKPLWIGSGSGPNTKNSRHQIVFPAVLDSKISKFSKFEYNITYRIHKLIKSYLCTLAKFNAKINSKFREVKFLISQNQIEFNVESSKTDKMILSQNSRNS